MLGQRSSENQSANKPSSFKSVGKTIRKIDQFQESFHFQLPNGSSTLPTYQGAFFSTIMFLILIFYGTMELLTLSTNGNSTIMNY